MSETYKALGVSATKEDVHTAIKDLDKGEFSGTFCKLTSDPCGDTNYCAAMHADGAGTKASLAYIKYRETNDYSPFFDLAQDSTVMNIDDLLCVGAVGGFVLSNTIDRNAHRVDGNAISAVISGYSAFAEKLRSFGVDVNLCGGETADVGDLASTLIVNSTAFVRIKKKDVINCENITPGDIIIGFSSYGKASYENSYNAGMGSNGLTAARHLMLHHDYAKKYPESFSQTIPMENVYTGRFYLSDKLPGADVSVGDAILSPTRTYAPIIHDILTTPELKNKIHGIIHCTGGGQGKCRSFGHGLSYIKDDLFEIPPLFRAIYDSGNISLEEMYKVFNMGHRLELFCDERNAEKIISISQKYNVDAKIIGHVESSGSDKNDVRIYSPEGCFTYHQ